MASFTLWWFIIQRGGFLHSACATVGMTYGGWYHSTAQVIIATWRAADCRRYTRYVQQYTQCSGVDPTPSSPGEGLEPLVDTNTNVPRFRPSGPGSGRLPPLQGVYHIWGVPFNGTGYTSNVAGGRLPPLRYICYKYRVFNVSIHVLRFGKCGKRGTLP